MGVARVDEAGVTSDDKAGVVSDDEAGVVSNDCCVLDEVSSGYGRCFL